MNIILDTHVFLWTLSEPERLNAEKELLIVSQANRIFVSSISVAEIMIKASIGKLEVNFNPVEMIDKSGFEHLPFSSHDAMILKDLPMYHKDPFDRMLIAQSITCKYHIMSGDSKFSQYPCSYIGC